MEFHNFVNKQGLVDDVLFLCQTTTAAYPVTHITRNINQAYHDVTRLIWESSDTWQYDDTNKGDIPKILTTLTSGTSFYAIPTTAQKIQRVEIKDSVGNWVKLKQVDYSDIGIAMPEYYENSGLPVVYDLVGNYINLYPPPGTNEVTLTSGMATYVDRDVTEFTTASTTTVPGFAPQFHRLLSLQAALDFIQDPSQRSLFLGEKQQLSEGLKRFYNSRSVEGRTEIKPAGKRHKRQYE
jgi:hypothetical protein